jgi:hypothetical protein
MKTNRILMTILTATLLASSTVFAQQNTSNSYAKLVSYKQERKSTLAIERLNQLTQLIAEKIRFKVPAVNDNENAVPVLLKYEYIDNSHRSKAEVVKETSFVSNQSENSSAEELNQLTRTIEEQVKFKAPAVTDNEYYEANLNEITSQIEEQIKFKAPLVTDEENIQVSQKNESVLKENSPVCSASKKCKVTRAEKKLTKLTQVIEEQIKFKAPSADINA